MSKKKLQERWTSDQVEIANKILVGKKENNIFDKVGDKIDFRGLPIKSFIKNVELIDIDFSFSYTEWAGQFGMAKVKSCIFNNIDYKSNLGDVFESCTFDKSKLNKVVFRGKFVNCDFNNANFTSAQGRQLKFIECNFIKVNFTKTHFLNSLFEKCVFTECKFGNGSFAGSIFKNSEIDLNNIGNTIVDNIKVDT